MGIWSDLDAAEKHAVFHFSFNLAAVCHQGIQLGRIVTVVSRHFIADFCINRKLVPEQSLPHFRIQDLHVEPEIALDRIDMPAFPLVFISIDLRAAALDQAEENILIHRMQAVCDCFVHQVQQQFAFHHKHLHIAVPVCRMGRLNLHIGYVAVLLNLDIRAVLIPDHGGILGVHQGDIRTCFPVKTDQFIQAGIVQDVAVAQHQGFLLAAGQIAVVGSESIQDARIQSDILTRQERRQNMKALMFAVQIPFLAGSEMVHQAVIIFLHDHADVFHSAVHHAGNQEVNHAESAFTMLETRKSITRNLPATGMAAIARVIVSSRSLASFSPV